MILDTEQRMLCIASNSCLDIVANSLLRPVARPNLKYHLPAWILVKAVYLGDKNKGCLGRSRSGDIALSTRCLILETGIKMQITVFQLMLNFQWSDVYGTYVHARTGSSLILNGRKFITSSLRARVPSSSLSRILALKLTIIEQSIQFVHSGIFSLPPALQY